MSEDDIFAQMAMADEEARKKQEKKIIKPIPVIQEEKKEVVAKDSEQLDF